MSSTGGEVNDEREPDLRKLIEGTFDTVRGPDRERIIHAVSWFHLRNCKKYDDGSLGEVYISPKQLRDLLAYWKRSEWIALADAKPNPPRRFYQPYWVWGPAFKVPETAYYSPYAEFFYDGDKRAEGITHWQLAEVPGPPAIRQEPAALDTTPEGPDLSS